MSYNFRLRPNPKCLKCQKSPVKTIIFDHRARPYCNTHCVGEITLGNCYVCGKASDPKWIYRVGFGPSDEETVDHYYATCSEKHFKKVDQMIVNSK